MAWHMWPIPIESESPSPETPIYVKSRFAAMAPVVMGGMRPCAELKPCAPFTKYAGVFEEQPIPLIFASRCGGIEISHRVRTMAAVMESCPQPAHKVDIEPS